MAAHSRSRRAISDVARSAIRDDVVDAVRRALERDTGSILVFLPGQGEITRVAERLRALDLPGAVDIAPLYGALDPATQDRAISPANAGHRKIVLATSIAETSITIEGVRVVIDSGMARVPRFEPDVGVTRLETVRVSRASADQRRGRAGRTEPGICYRLWDEPETQDSCRSQSPKSASPIFRACFSIAPNGARMIRDRLPGSTHQARARCRPRDPDCKPLARSTPRTHHTGRAAAPRAAIAAALARMLLKAERGAG